MSEMMGNKIEWDGAGKPPIGCECEYKMSRCGVLWFRIKILGVGQTHYFVKFGDGNEGTLLIDEVTIRNYTRHAEALYEAGYHNGPKQGKVVSKEDIHKEWEQQCGWSALTLSSFIFNNFTITRKVK